MSRISYQIRSSIISLLLATSFISVTAAKTPQPKAAQSSTASTQDKAKACNDLADKKGLKDKDRQTFMQSCLNKAADSGSRAPTLASRTKRRPATTSRIRKG